MRPRHSNSRNGGPMRAKHRARYRDQVETEIDNLNRLDEEYIDLVGLADAECAMRQVVCTVPSRVEVDVAFIGKPGPLDTLVLSNLVGFNTSAMKDLVVGPGKGLAGR